jgi:roadblock/LC7 domain-containing protein
MPVPLNTLLEIDGVTVAFEFIADGKCVDYRGKGVTAEMAAMITRYCGLVTMSFSILAGAFTTLSEQNWIPEKLWTYTGGDYTVVVGGYRGVFIETAKADLNELRNALSAD